MNQPLPGDLVTLCIAHAEDAISQLIDAGVTEPPPPEWAEEAAGDVASELTLMGDPRLRDDAALRDAFGQLWAYSAARVFQERHQSPP